MNSNDECECKLGFYDIGNENCSACHYTCDKCNGNTANDCLICRGDNSISHRTLTGNICNCDPGYYDNGTNQICMPCHVLC